MLLALVSLVLPPSASLLPISLVSPFFFPLLFDRWDCLRSRDLCQLKEINLGVYAIAAIWSNLELYLGVIGANLALSRQIYLYFFRGQTTPHDSKYGDRNNYVRSSFSQSNPRSGHITDKLRSGAGESVIDRAATLIESRRKVSMSRSDGSEVELESGIRKKTEFWISEGGYESQGSAGRAR